MRVSDVYMFQVAVEDLNEQDLLWIASACEDCYYGYTPKDIFAETITGHFQLWKFGDAEEHCTGIMITRLDEYPAGKELWIWGVAGRGYVRNFPVIRQTIMNFAKASKCKWVSGMATLPRLETLYNEMGAKRQATFYIKEV